MNIFSRKPKDQEEPETAVAAETPATEPQTDQEAPGTEQATEPSAVIPEGTTSEESEEVEQEVPNPHFEGAQVEEVLQRDVHGQWHRCAMTDGTTKDVPIHLFRVVKRIPTSPSA
jgi:hypothetical protein